MTKSQPYTYTVLRYMHDVMTSEFVNVGLVMHVPGERKVLTKTRRTIGRIKGVFPDLDRGAFLSAMRAVERALTRITREQSDAKLPFSEGSAASFAVLAVPADNSSLQWSEQGSGLTHDAEKTFDRLYHRYVARYDVRGLQRRTDEDVWRPVRQKLEEKHLASLLQEKVIEGPLDQVRFKHAWKNGKWHVYEPVSFDLAEADSIKAKAREWLGHLAAVVSNGSAEPFQPHFIVGAPSDPALASAFNSAVAILAHAPNDPRIFVEEQVDQLVAQIEDEVREHSAESLRRRT